MQVAALPAEEPENTERRVEVVAGADVAVGRRVSVKGSRFTEGQVLMGSAASRLAAETSKRLALVRRALDDAHAPGAAALRLEAKGVEARLRELRRALDGDSVMAARNEGVPPSLSDRVNYAVATHYSSTAAPTATSRRQVEVASAEFATLLAGLRAIVETDLPRLEAGADAAGAPWTPGRVPVWPPANR